MSDDYKEDLKIDFFNLHIAYRDQAANYMDWAEKWANSDQDRDKRKRFLRINIRANPSNYDLPGNPSVAAVNAVIEEDEEYIRLSHETHIFASAMKALEHMRYNIDGLVRLYLNGYFSGPHPSTATVRDQVKSERGERVHTAQRDKLQHTRRKIGRRRDGTSAGTKEETQVPEEGTS